MNWRRGCSTEPHCRGRWELGPRGTAEAGRVPWFGRRPWGPEGLAHDSRRLDQGGDRVADLIEPADQGPGTGVAVEQVRQAVQEVAQEVAGARVGDDVDRDRAVVAVVQVHH